MNIKNNKKIESTENNINTKNNIENTENNTENNSNVENEINTENNINLENTDLESNIIILAGKILNQNDKNTTIYHPC